MTNQYKFLDSELKDVFNQMRAYCKKYLKNDYMLLRSVPGIAGLTASYILAELGDLRRFSFFEKIANRHVRNLIIESAWVAIRQYPVIQQYYRSHAGEFKGRHF